MVSSTDPAGAPIDVSLHLPSATQPARCARPPRRRSGCEAARRRHDAAPVDEASPGAPSQLIDIARLPELHGISRSGQSLAIGAASRYAEIARHPLVEQHLPALAQVADAIGDPQVRSRGTIGGSIANNDPAADFPAAVLALAAVIRTDRREIAADDYFQGMFTTALAPDEMICEIRFAIPRRAAYAKFHHPASGYAMAGVFVADFGETVRVAVTGAAPVVFRWHEAEAALTADFAPEAVARPGACRRRASTPTCTRRQAIAPTGGGDAAEGGGQIHSRRAHEPA